MNKLIDYMKKLYTVMMFPSQRAVIRIRISIFYSNKGLKILARYSRNKLLKKYSIDLSDNTKIGSNLAIPHPVGIVLGNLVEIGDNVTIYQNVTLGAKKDSEGNLVYPKIGNNVSIFTGSTVIGDVQVGDNVIIGANSVVIADCISNSIYAGNPSKRIKVI